MNNFKIKKMKKKLSETEKTQSYAKLHKSSG